ncbi:helix-turn-helix domain-containing protein [Clostridium akagii]|uniref:helix-turn-helix domain-containing protein n=1 Tax=Clostridium akagii TaxID=91623 RepID=UPI000478DB11|nr:helix-turn-helix domain-containing protein [Clostridium akagii]
MKISEQIKILCVRTNISVAELSRRVGQSPQNFSAKMKRESFTISELQIISEAVDATFEHNFILKNGDKV